MSRHRSKLELYEAAAIPDCIINKRTYSIHACDGRWTRLITHDHICESFLEFLDMCDTTGELKKVLGDLKERGARIKDIIKWVILDLENANEIYYFMYEDLLSAMDYSVVGDTLQYDSRYGLSKGVFMQAMRTCQTLSEKDLEDAMLEDLLKSLPKCKTIEDLLDTIKFKKLADDSPLLKKIVKRAQKKYGR